MSAFKINGKKCEKIIDKLINKQAEKGKKKMDKFLKWLILLLIVLMIIILFYSNVKAETEPGWKLSANIYKTVASDVESIVQGGSGVQVSLYRKNLFLYLSKDVNQVRFAGQSGPDINLWSAGIGMQRTVGKYLTLSLAAGWYEPRFKEMGEPQTWKPVPSSPLAEGLRRYLNEFLIPDDSYPDWDYYTLNYHGAIGGKLNLAFEYPITESLSFNMVTGYRYLKLLENVQGRNRLDHPGDIDWSANYWTVRYDRDFSALMIGGALTFKF